jgi:hypothetical protein
VRRKKSYLQEIRSAAGRVSLETAMLPRRLALGLSLLAATLAVAEPPEDSAPLAFAFSLPGDEIPEARKLPFFRVFPGGKDKQGKDASGALGTIKLARGQSKLYPAEDAKAGLIVVLRRILFVPLADGDYNALLEGEFNAVQSLVSKKTMDRLRAGERTELVFASDITKGFRPVSFRIQATTRLQAQLRDGDLLFYEGRGDTTITHNGLRRSTAYESTPVLLKPEEGRPLYIGRSVKPILKSDGSPETLPVIN